MSKYSAVPFSKPIQDGLLALLVMMVTCLASPFVMAGPANIVPLVVEQPDGARLTVRMRGDEFQGWTETADGYTIVQNPDTRYFEYATRSALGDLLPSGIVAVSDASKRVGLIDALPPKGLRPARNTDLESAQRETLNSVYRERLQPADSTLRAQTGTWAPRPVSGTKKMLVILVNFADQKLDVDAPTYWYDTIFNPGTRSVSKYFQDNSYGKLVVAPVRHSQTGSPEGVVSVTISRNHPACAKTCNLATETAVINAALGAATPYVDFVGLDTNGDGTISRSEALFYFIYAGYEASAGLGTPSIWAHAWSGSGVAVAGRAVPVWAINGDRYNKTERMRMGIVTHELGHQMAGLPDLYDTSETNSGIGIFSVMASGSWGGQQGEIGGTTATGYDAWSRQYLGWSTLQTPVDGQAATLVSGLASDRSTFILMNESVSSSEFWLVENRPPIEWDKGMWAGFNMGDPPPAPPVQWQGGLLIEHVDLNIGSPAANDFNKYVAGGHQGDMVVEASTSDCTLLDNKSWGCPSLLYYAGNNATLDDSSKPNSRYYNGRSSGFGITGISAAGSSMVATFSRAAVGKTLSSLVIEGPAKVNEREKGSYTAKATYTDGSVYTVQPTWNVDSPDVTIAFSGELATDSVPDDLPITISATHSEGGITRIATRAVTIVHTDVWNGAGTTSTALLVEKLSGLANTQQRYKVKVPAGAANLVFSVDGAAGDVDLFVKAGSPPGNSIGTSDCASYTRFAIEACVIPAPEAGVWYVLLDAYTGYSDVSLRVTYETPGLLEVTKLGTGSGTIRSSAVVSSYATPTQVSAIDARIVGGSPALSDSWPWQVALATVGGVQFCGGSLLSDRWVVSAAHCLVTGTTIAAPASVKVRVGSLLKDSGGTLFDVKRVVIHEQYNGVSKNNDIALLELATPVDPRLLPEGSVVAAIDPLVPADESRLVVDGSLATVTGWGDTEPGGNQPPTLRQVTLPLVTSDSCRKPDYSKYGDKITANMICAGYSFGEKDSCQGDSGGPLVVPNGRGGWVLAGIVSWGRGCADADYPGVYTRVANYRDWLQSQTGLALERPLIDCGSACGARLGLDSRLTLTATPQPGSVFAGWLSTCTGTGPTCAVKMSSASRVGVTAQFRYAGSAASWSAVRDAYIAYYGRPGDPEGLGYWAGQTDAAGGDFSTVINAFGNSPEFTNRFGGLTNAELVVRIYRQSLARDPDVAGLAWYVAELNAGRTTPQKIAIDVFYGATVPPDANAVANKRQVADYYTAKVAAGCSYGSEATGIDFLTNVTADGATVGTAKAAIDARCGR